MVEMNHSEFVAYSPIDCRECGNKIRTGISISRGGPERLESPNIHCYYCNRGSSGWPDEFGKVINEWNEMNKPVSRDKSKLCDFNNMMCDYPECDCGR